MSVGRLFLQLHYRVFFIIVVDDDKKYILWLKIYYIFNSGIDTALALISHMLTKVNIVHLLELFTSISSVHDTNNHL